MNAFLEKSLGSRLYSQKARCDIAPVPMIPSTASYRSPQAILPAANGAERHIWFTPTS